MLHKGEVYVACQLDCGYTLFGLTLPPDGEDPAGWRQLFPQMELFEEGGLVPLEGGDADEH